MKSAINTIGRINESSPSPQFANCGLATMPVAALGLNRYLGEWYEVARFDHGFERGYDTDKLIWVWQEI